VRKLVWLPVACVIAGLLVLAAELPSWSTGLLDCLPRNLWVLPFSVTIISISLLVGNFFLGGLAPVGFPGKLLSLAYLSTGPSLAIMGVLATLGAVIPAWVDYVTPALLPMSAWAYYKSLGPLEEDGTGISGAYRQAEYEIWAMGIGLHSSGVVQSQKSPKVQSPEFGVRAGLP